MVGQFHEVKIMADKTLPTRPVSPEGSKDQSAISEDITRIVGYLNTKRSNANERTSDLVQEITQRHKDILGRLTGRLDPSPELLNEIQETTLMMNLY